MTEIKDILQQKSLKVLIVGDACWDHYHYGSVSRISPEAPVPVFDYENWTKKEGMANNVSKNFSRLSDHRYNKLYNHTFLVETKNRYIDKKSKQQLFRVDEKHDQKGINSIFDDAIHTLKDIEIDLIIVSDYDKGTLSYDNIEALISIANSENIDIFIDTKKKDLARFEGAFIKINELEYNSSTSKCSNIIVTRAENGVVYHRKLPDAPSWFPVRPIEFRDVTGAGDTFLAAVSLMYALTKDINESIMFANKAAEITIQHYGCYAPTLEEICGYQAE